MIECFVSVYVKPKSEDSTFEYFLSSLGILIY